MMGKHIVFVHRATYFLTFLNTMSNFFIYSLSVPSFKCFLRNKMIEIKGLASQIRLRGPKEQDLSEIRRNPSPGPRALSGRTESKPQEGAAQKNLQNRVM
jgi:hypothetical protein